MMGVNLSVVGTCLPHRVDKAVCALHADITHGQCVAFFYPTWVRLSAAGSEARFAKVARILDPSSAGETDLADASGCSALIAEILDKIGLGKPPSAFGVVPGDIPRIIERMTGDLSANPFAVSPGDLKSFLEETIR
jgi:alcohol dehydrogenase class IV